MIVRVLHRHFQLFRMEDFADRHPPKGFFSRGESQDFEEVGAEVVEEVVEEAHKEKVIR